MHKATVTLLLLAVTAVEANGQGINLSWDDCGTNGVDLKSFACNTNEGNDRLIVSFEMPAGVEFVYYATASLTVTTATILPDWWRFREPDAPPFPLCRDTLGMRVSHEPQATQCSSAFPSTDFVLFSSSPQNAGNNRLTLAGTVGSLATPVPSGGGELYLVTFMLSHARTAGLDSCSGCGVPACIFLEKVVVKPADAEGIPLDSIEITDVLNSRLVRWQGAEEPQCPFAPVPTRKSSWGSVRSLYR